MFKVFPSKIKGKKEDKSSEFSKFFRNASSGEKKKVFMDAARKASKEQAEVIRNSKMTPCRR